MVTSETEITDAAGEHVVTATSVLARGGGGRMTRRSTVGDVVAERTVHLTRESLVRYAGASGDFNPIHYRDDVAAAVGLPGVLAHGMLTMGLAVETIVPWLGDAGRILDYGVRFTRPVVVDPETGADVTHRREGRRRRRRVRAHRPHRDATTTRPCSARRRCASASPDRCPRSHRSRSRS